MFVNNKAALRKYSVLQTKSVAMCGSTVEFAC